MEPVYSMDYYSDLSNNMLSALDQEIQYAAFDQTHRLLASPGIRILYAPPNPNPNPNQNQLALFRPGIFTTRPIRRIRLNPASSNYYPPSWEQRTLTLPNPGFIRLFDEPSGHLDLNFLWTKDITLTDWLNTITDAENNNRGTDFLERLKAVFYTNQRKRWLARLTLQRWTQRVWRKRTQCNVDMIDMVTFPDKDAVYLTDTKHRHIFRFHRRDVFTNLLANICMSDEMLPSPRYPTNPWTNEKLTQAQTIGLCHQLVADYGRRCRSPPVLFAAFWASRFSLKRFQLENSAILAQHAVTAYFKDLHDDNHGTVYDTITTLLSNGGLHYSSVAVRRWLRDPVQTPMHREWLALTRDYTLYINLHVQARPNWYSRDRIYADVRRLYERTTFPEVATTRMQLLRSTGLNADPPLLPNLMQTYTFDLSGSAMSNNAVIQLIQDALFRL